MIKLVLKMQTEQNEYRHDLRVEFQSAMLSTTEAISHRIDRLEDVMQGLFSARRGRGD